MGRAPSSRTVAAGAPRVDGRRGAARADLAAVDARRFTEFERGRGRRVTEADSWSKGLATIAGSWPHRPGAAAADARETMAELKRGVDEIIPQTSTLLTNINEFTVEARDLSGSIGNEIDGVGAEAKVALAEVRGVLKDFGQAARTLSELVEANREPVDAFASSGLYELTQMLTEARVLMGALTRIAAQIERDPARFLFGQTKPGVEVK